jgi:TonB-linked SusC/RagA family outer membrane protein
MKIIMSLKRKLAGIIMIFLISLQVSASGLYQMTLDSGKITLNVKSITIKQVLSLIEQQSVYRFLFNDELPELNQSVDINVKNVDIEHFLITILEKNSAKAQFLENNLVVITRNQSVQSQQVREFVGVVVDAVTGEELIGANVVIKGSTTGTITNIKGEFVLSGIDANTTVVVSYIGYKNFEFVVGTQTSIIVKLHPDGANLNEVVVIGYGTLRKSDVTAAISSVKPEELMVRATTNPAEALQGRVAGVNIQKFGGNAGAGVYVKIRGVNTSGSNEPLYIIDGFPGNIANVNPADIESMEVLKDGAAAAIYGSVAANGVIIVTTRQGKAGDVKVDVNTYMSMTQTAKTFDLLDADGYRKVHRQMYENAGEVLPAYITNASAINTNWQDQVFRNGMAYNHSIGLRGGYEKLTFALSANVADEKGIIIDNSYKQENARMKLNFKKSIFDVDAQIAFASTKSKQPNFSLKEVYMISPLVPVFDANEKYGYGLTNKNGLPNNVNPVAQEHFVTSWSKGQDVTANFSVAANFTKWLQYKTSYSYRGKNTQAYYHRPTFIADPKVPNEYPYYQEQRTYSESQVIDNTLSFNKKFENHSFNVMLGNSVQKDQSSWSATAVEGKTTVYSVQDGKLVTTEKPGGFLDEYFMTLNAGSGGTFSADG